MRKNILRLASAAGLTVLAVAPAGAQPLGTFSWQLAPYCNVVTVSVTQNGGLYTLDGYENQCGGPVRAAVIGMAVPNPNGSITLGFTIVTPPGAAPVHVQTAIDLGSLGGTWADNQGNSGGFVFTPSGTATGSPRPPAGTGGSGLTPNSVTSLHLVDGSVRGADIDPSQVQARIASGCPANQYMRNVGANGSPACEAVTTAVNATQLGGVPAGQHVLVSDPRLSDARQPLAGSASYVRIGAVPQPGDFAINGSGTVGGTLTAGVVSSSAQFNLGTNRLIGKFGTNNLVAGFLAGGANAGARNTLVGDSAGVDNTGSENTFLGFVAGQRNTTGSNNVYIGSRAGYQTGAGSFNTFAGDHAGQFANGGDNTAFGASSLGALLGGDANVAVGRGAGGALLNGSNNLYLDNSGTATESNTVRIGSTARHSRLFAAGVRGVTTGVNNAVGVVVDSAGQLGTVSSSRRTKFDIGDLDPSVTAALQRLRPVQFRYRQAFADGSTPIQYGLIAEEVQEVLPELVALDDAGEPASVKYHVLPGLLLAEVQRLERERAALAEAFADQRRELDDLRRAVAGLRDARSTAAPEPR